MAFDKHAEGETGTVNVEGVASVAAMMQLEMSPTEVKQAFPELGKDENAGVSFEVLQIWWTDLQAEQWSSTMIYFIIFLLYPSISKTVSRNGKTRPYKNNYKLHVTKLHVTKLHVTKKTPENNVLFFRVFHFPFLGRSSTRSPAVQSALT